GSEAFRGLLLGLFFLGVGMSLDIGLILSSWYLILGTVVGFMALKVIGIYAVSRVRSDHAEGLRIALLLAQGGEFAFVLYATATGVFILDAHSMAFLNTAVIISMALTPLAPLLIKRISPPKPVSLEGIDVADGL